VATAVLASTSIGTAAKLINGAGATFPYPIYSKWFDDYRKVNSDVQINYQSIGSGGGIRQVLEGTVDFGASDGPMTDEQLGQAKTPILHFPTVLGAVVATFNVPGVDQLKLTSDALAGIFLGKITMWNDPALAKENPRGTARAAHRSGTVRTAAAWTYVFVDYLSKVSPEWAKTVGRNTSVAWPVGLGGRATRA
jgi:phosphate transport system substrate-binding protein